MYNLIPDFKDAIWSGNKENIPDYIELGIDTVISDEILKEVPMVKTIWGISKTIYDRNAMKNIVIFISEFNSKTIDKRKLDKYKAKLDADKKYAEKELGRVLLLLNRFIDNKKVVMLSRLYRAYINENINLDEFYTYSEIIDRLFIEDIEVLKNIYICHWDGMINNFHISTSELVEEHKLNRLSAMGLIKINPRIETWEDTEEIKEYKIEKNIFAEKFVKCVFY